eukprot:TRINITY_DN49728_c0_g1_i1.p1 TRINITY_DN49728_c0_g1~~TRINITY_DN49728_c0_g1_i1.p1  ORF type:complete len:421 (-),score=52.80 TRINITY_DN49728_c0_g1_i1:87-1349(-)
MQVKDDGGFAAEASRCVAEIEMANFVALDCEFSGLFLNPTKEHTTLPVEEYFTKCVESIPQFLLLQLGICCARWQPVQQTAVGGGTAQTDGKWELRSYEFNLWPDARRVFKVDLESLRYLRRHRFDFNAFFDSAYTYSRLPVEDGQNKGLEPHQNDHVTRVLFALRKARIPLVFHNGLLDMLHMYDKFFGDLPKQHGDFGSAWIAQFPLLFDTRAIAQQGGGGTFRRPVNFTLLELRKHFSALDTAKVQIERSRPLEKGKKNAHGSAAYDAMLTAEVFLMEMNACIRGFNALADIGDCSTELAKKRRSNDGSVSAAVEMVRTADTNEADGEGWTVVSRSRKRRHGSIVATSPFAGGAVAEDVSTGSGLCNPSLLQSHEACRRFHNRLAIVGASRNFLEIGGGPGVPGFPGTVCTASVQHS